MELLNKYIDHTLLKPTASEADIIKLCNEAKKYNFCSVCVNPYYVRLASKNLKNEDNIAICAVIGFPLGANRIETKTFEALVACRDGATEIDMVINIAELKNKNAEYCLKEINDVKATIGKNVLKVIVETAYLTEEEKQLAAKIVLESDADFIKTSTGFAPLGAQIEDIKMWKRILGNNKKIKASGGIKDYKTCLEFVKAGADRIGTSSGVDIVEFKEGKSDY